MATRDYREWRLPQLWAMVSGDLDITAVRHLNTWDHEAWALDIQRTRLRELLTELEAKWPPATSVAATAFIGHVKDMIQAMDDTVLASTAIRNGLKLVVEATDKARQDLRPLLDQYNDQAAAWKSFHQRPMPLVGKGMAPLTPATPGVLERALAWHQMQLDEQARIAMRAADARVTEARSEINKELPAYDRFHDEREPIPPPSQPGGDRSTGSPLRNGSSRIPIVPAPQFDLPAPPQADSGPVLAGGPPALPGGVGTVPDAGLGSSGIGPVGSGISGGVPIPPGAGSWSVRTVSGQTVMRPGGVIGEPAAGRTSITHPGGMIAGGVGGTTPSTRPMTRNTAPQHPAMGRVLGEPREGSTHPISATGGWRDSQYDEYARRRRHPAEADPDNPWTVEEGVPPLLDAPDEPIHIVGPGVIGLDR